MCVSVYVCVRVYVCVCMFVCVCVCVAARLATQILMAGETKAGEDEA